MTELIATLLDWVRLHPVWAGWVVFLVSFAESLAIVGMIVPGVVVLLGVGAVIAAGAADFWTMCAWAVAGAVAGDGLSYWLGRRYHSQLRRRWPFSRYPGSLDQGERFFRKYGGISVAFARFFGPGRAAVPLVAGMLSMPPMAFLAANVGSALLWAPAYLLPGVALGASLEIASEVALRLALLLVLLIGLLWFAGWASHRVFSLVQPHSRDWLQRLLGYGGRNRLLLRIARALANPRHPEAQGLAAFAGLLLVSALAAGILLSVLPWQALDGLVARTLTSLRTPGADQVMAAIATAGEPAAGVLLTLGLAIFYGVLRRRLTLKHWLGGMLLATIVSALLAVFRIEPGASLIPDRGTLIASGLIGLQTIILAGSVGLSRRWLLYATGVIALVSIFFARIYLGLASFSGVLSAAAIALVWGSAIGIAYRTHAPHERLSHAQAGASAGLGLLCLVGFALARPLDVPTPPPSPDLVMSEAEWRAGGWRRLPAERSDLRGDGNQPLNLQFLGEPDRLATRLEELGWQPAPPPGPADYTRLLSSSLPLARLPLLPHVHDGRHERYAWVLNETLPEERRLVLRLWATRFHDGDPSRRYWLGEISSQRRRTRFGLLAYAVTVGRYDQAASALVDQLPAGIGFEPRPRHGAAAKELLLLAQPRVADEERRVQ